ncbi:Cytochrome c oxidase assembly factor 7 [Aphanomyces cochlioides]|nr:Cytochrome c oxidase assembly factor 7 [Aphanomyces cochlioides]
MSEKSAEETKRLNEELQKRHYEFVSNCDDGNGWISRSVLSLIQCALGDASACHSYGEWLAVVDKKYDEAAAVYKKNCDKKNYPASCFNYGRFLLAGKGVELNDEEGRKMMVKSCNAGHTHGCHHLGIMYLNGIGGEKNVEKGIAAIEKACNNGEGSSCYRLGSMFLTTQSKYGIARNVVKAKKYLESACDANFAPACHNLAVMYKTGDGEVKKDQALYEAYSLKTKKLAEQSGAVGGGVRAA